MNSVANSAFFPSGSREGAVLHLPRQPARLPVDANWASWQNEVLQRIECLVQLERGWDGYNAPPVLLENAYFAIQMLRAITPSDMTAPQIVPGSLGDLQVEWHVGDRSVELHVKGPNSVSAWRESPDLPEGEGLELTNDFAPILGWIADLRGGAIGAVTAAA